MRRLGLALLVGLLAAAPAAGAESHPKDDGLESRRFTVHFKAVEAALLVIQPHLGVDGSITLHPRERALTVLDKPEHLLQVEEALHEFDVPSRHVNVAIQLIMGLREAEEEPQPPPELSGIDGNLQDTLRSTTRWDQYRLLGSASLVASEGEESTLMLSEEYRIRFAVDTVNEQQAVTRFDRFALERRRPAAAGDVAFAPIWDVVLNLQDNQLYVFGATRLEDSRKAIFLSITAGIVE